MEAELQRRELALFLRTRRERLSPEEVGLKVHGRRRGRGLKREEVAQRAAISTTWYTWLEQGRPIRVSEQVAHSLSLALCLNRAERDHFYMLLGRVPHDTEVVDERDLSPVLKQLVDSHVQCPALIVNSKWFMQHWNEAAGALFGIDNAPPYMRNVLRFLFLSSCGSWTETRLHDVEAALPASVAQFNTQSAPFADDEDLGSMIDDLSSRSHLFRELRERRDVECLPYSVRTFVHPRHGRMTFNLLSLDVTGHPELKLHLYLPQDRQTPVNLANLCADTNWGSVRYTRDTSVASPVSYA